MKKVQLAGTGEKVSAICMGTMYFGSKVPERVSFELLDYYTNQGGDFLDTANKYASWIPGFKGGESEELIGKWMKERNNRDELFLTSKVGFAYGWFPQNLKRDTIISECEKSLKRLGVETIDLYFAHTFDVNIPEAEIMESFRLLKKSGKIRFVGASNFTLGRLAIANNAAELSGWEGFIALQQRHSYIQPWLGASFGTQLVLTPDHLEYCKMKGITMMGYTPLLGGAYVCKDMVLPLQYQNVENAQRLKILNELSTEIGATPNQLVLAWMMQNDPVVLPIVSASSLAHLRENLRAAELVITPEQITLLNNNPDALLIN